MLFYFILCLDAYFCLFPLLHNVQGFDDSALISLAFERTGLRRLSLSASKVTDASLIAVAQLLAQLTELELALCEMVTDRGALRLTQLRHLQLLNIIDSGITQEGQQAVSAAVCCDAADIIAAVS